MRPAANLVWVALTALGACGSGPTQISEHGARSDDTTGVRRGVGTDGATIRIATQDGLALHFDQGERQFTAWSVAGPGPGSGPGLDAGWQTQLSADWTPLGVALADHRGVSTLEPTRDAVRAVERTDRGLRIVRERPDTGLRVVETWIAHARHIELQATIAVIDNPGSGTPAVPAASDNRSRAIEACLALPLDAVGKTWHHHLHQSEVIAADGEYRTLLTPEIDIGHHSPDGKSSHIKSLLPFNLHGLNAITDPGDRADGRDARAGAGIAIAMHPQSPGSYFVAYHGPSRQLRACFHLGIHAGHRTHPDRTSMRLLLMGVDRPAWGLRSALAEYVSVVPAWFRGRLPRQTGMTVGGGYSHRHYPRPQDFHISSMWNVYRPQNRDLGIQNLMYAWPTGYLERGLRLRARPTAGPCADCDRSIDAHVAACMQLYEDYENGAVRFPETCGDPWAQRDCRASVVPPTTDKSYGPVRIRRLFADLIPYQVIEPSEQELRLLGKFAVREPLGRSILRGPDGRQHGALSDSMGLLPVPGTKGIYTCYINGFNPDPGVLVRAAARKVRTRDRGRQQRTPPVETANFGHLNLEIARRATGVYGAAHVRRTHAGPVIFDGVALDTVGAYLRPDFNPDMLAVASHPLAYDPDSGRLVAMEHLGLSAFMAELRSQLPDRVSIAINGYPISGTLGQGVDHFVREMARRWRRGPGDERPRHYYELYDEDLDLRLRRVYRARMVAVQRPITFWTRFVHTDKRAAERGVSPEQALLTDMRALLPMYTATGVYAYLQRTGISHNPRFLGAPQDPQLMAEYRRHLDTVAALTRAGWQPVPHASGRDEAGARIVMERFGGQSNGAEQLFTVYNTGARPASVTVTIEWADIGHSQQFTGLRDWHTGAQIATERAPANKATDAATGAEVRAQLTIEVGSPL